MKQIILLILSFQTTLFADIRPISTIAEVETVANTKTKHTLIVFTIDNTLTMPTQGAFQLPTVKQYATWKKEIAKDWSLEMEKTVQLMVPLKTKLRLTETRTPDVLNALKGKKYPIIALLDSPDLDISEAISPAKKLATQLAPLNLSFATTYSSQEEDVLNQKMESKNKPSRIDEGILLTNMEKGGKAQALKTFIENLSFKPERVIVVDRDRTDLNTIELALKNSSVEFVGLLYSKADEVAPQTLSEKEFNDAWETIELAARDAYSLTVKLKPAARANQWFALERRASGANPNVQQLNTPILTTISPEGQPTSQVMSTSDLFENGVVYIYSHRDSSKMENLTKNPQVCLLYWLPETQRQILIEGKALELPREIAAQAWDTTPERETKLFFLATHPKKTLGSFSAIQKKMAELGRQYTGQIPVPDDFVAVSIVPERFTFFALIAPFAEKFIAEKENEEWVTKRVQP
ncbi:MAG: DUF2608 domain-containing protein [Chlamydiia bacterium]|nr:DUF2608 domain-containing protein [Chlamydiia bacterium]